MHLPCCFQLAGLVGSAYVVFTLNATGGIEELVAADKVLTSS